MRPALAFAPLVAALALGSPSLASSGTGSADATLDTFAGTWSGHTRGLVISRKGRARESVDSGCCEPVIDFKYRLTHPRGTERHATIKAKVTEVHVHDRGALGKPPHVGDTGHLRLDRGVITDPFIGATFCDAAASSQGACGA
jgi:hypothetical protein